jgi:phosphoglycolate phosphatase-like HAD superfamily hydrolase
MGFVGVAWGFRSRKQLEQAGAQNIISSPSELLEFFSEKAA